jgi:hypothetical protein
VRVTIALVLISSLAGCDGGGSTSGGTNDSTSGAAEDSLSTHFDGFDQASLKGKTGTSTAATLTSGGATSSNVIGVDFAKDGTVRVIKADGTMTPVMTYDPTFHIYSDASETYTLLVLRDANSDDVGYFFFGDYSNDPVGSSDWTKEAFVLGNKTDPGSLPAAGQATYTGTLNVGGTYASYGSIVLNVDFSNATIGGNFDIAQGITTEKYNIKTASLSGGGFSTGAVDATTSAEMGTINGDFYGPDGSAVGGTIQVDSQDGPVIGGYMADR